MTISGKRKTTLEGEDMSNWRVSSSLRRALCSRGSVCTKSIMQGMLWMQWKRSTRKELNCGPLNKSLRKDCQSATFEL